MSSRSRPPLFSSPVFLSSIVALGAAVSGQASRAPPGRRPGRAVRCGSSSSVPIPTTASSRPAGTAARWAKLGHKVKFVSVTNGDIGHHEMAGAILARRRTAEVKKCAEILGIETEVLDIHDGELLPTLENRRTITRKIREWKADVVIAHRPNDYHPDHRYTGILVQDAAFMVIVPSFCPDVPALRKNPVFLYTEDDFKKPNPFAPDVVVPIDPVFDQKVACVDALESQFYEWNPWLFGYLDRGPQGEGRAAGLDARPGGQALRRDGRPVPPQADRAPGRREGQGRQVRRELRGLRVRHAADARRAAADLPVLRPQVISPRRAMIRRSSIRAATKRRKGQVPRAVMPWEPVPCRSIQARSRRAIRAEESRPARARRSGGGGPCRSRRPRPCDRRG